VVGHSAAEAAAPASKAWANFDFVPGERVIFAEDFTADRVGNFPRRLEFIVGNMEVVEWQGKRWLRSSGRSTLVIPLPEVLPERFTMELDLTLNWNGTVISFGPRDRTDISDTHLFNSTWHENYVVLSGTTAGVQGPRREGGSVVDPRRYVGHDPEGTMVRLRIDADGKYVKVYMNENRVANWPNANISRTNQIHVDIAAFNAEDREMLIGNISVNAGGQTMYDALVADGRFATQGILFDTGSDRLRPESTPTLKEIGEMLKAHPALRIRIEGHTDNVGNAASNQTLSEKRAAAVKAFLEKEYKIKGDRLEAQGFGDTKPEAKNDTPEARQTNRRVELVKL
jgi:outer membrane protein OmpA-like peptidoglycan-associated protein